MDIHQQSSALGDHKYRLDHYHKKNKINGGKQIDFSSQSNQFEKQNQKWE